MSQPTLRCSCDDEKAEMVHFWLPCWHMHPLPYFLIDLNCQGCLGVGCLSLRTFYLRAGITSDVSATPHLHGGPVHIFSTRRVDFDDFLPILITFPCCLLSVLVACPCCLFFLPVLFPYPLSMHSSLSFLVLPLVSFTFLLGFVWYQCVGESFKGTWLGLMSLLRYLAQTVLLRRFAYDRLFVAFPKSIPGLCAGTTLGPSPRHCIGAFPRQYFGVVSKYYCGALAKHYIGVLHMHIDIDF